MLEVTVNEHGPAGGPVHLTGLRRREGKLVTLKCGCQSDDTRWLALCEPVHLEVQRVKALCRAGAVKTVMPADDAEHASLLREAADVLESLTDPLLE